MRLSLRSALLAIGLLLAVPALPAPVGEDEHEQPTEINGMRRGWVVDTQDREAVRLFWRVRYRAAPPSGFWSGDLSHCDPGETLKAHRDASLARINWFRAMAGVPADMQEDPAATRKTQAATLVVMANHRISHDIDAGWRCFSEDAKEGASNSLLGLGANGPEAVTNFMRDDGPDNAAVHHRRWLLYPQSKFIGLGDVSNTDKAQEASGFTAFDGLYGSNRPRVVHDFVAWPPPGWVPYQVVFPRWSFSLAGADFSAATVMVDQAGTPLTLQLEPRSDTAGEPSLAWRLQADEAPMARPARDTRYHVVVDGVKVAGEARHFAYDVNVFDPDAPAPGQHETVVIGPARIGPTGAQFAVPPQPGATGSEWRALHLERWSLAQGAEHGYGAFSYAGSNDYAVIQAEVTAGGRQAFRLAHTHLGDESLTLAQPLVAGAQTRLAFKSRRGVAGSDEAANVDVLVEGRDSWETVYAQRSDGRTASAEKEFSEHQVDLSPYAGRLLQLRFRYAFATGSYFTPDDARVGWYLDDIRLDGAWRVVNMGQPMRSNGGKFEFKPDRSGEWRLQARPLVYRAAGDWGPLAAVIVE